MGAPAQVAADALHRVRAHWGDRHYRNGYYLMLNSLTGAAAGLLFWLVVVRLYHLPVRDVGIGVAAISLATAIALVAKGGLDAALVRHVPQVAPRQALRLLDFAIAMGTFTVAAIVFLIGFVPWALGVSYQGLYSASLTLLGALATLLMVTWLQDAHFLAEGEARFSFYRNLVLHSTRLLAPGVVLWLALPYPVPVAWALALLASALAAWAMVYRLPRREPPALAPPVRSRTFLRTATHNLAGGAAEFLPGLVLAPLVLAMEGPEAAAHFGIAWTGASLLFLLSGAIGRSTFAELSRTHRVAPLLRKALRHHAMVVLPMAVAAILLAPWLLALFGPGYAAHGLPVFLLLAASIALVAPVYLYLALLRSRDDRRRLVGFPLVLIVALLALTPPLEARLGLVGVGVAWLVAHGPLALYAAVQLRRALRADREDEEEVEHAERTDAPAHGGRAHVE